MSLIYMISVIASCPFLSAHEDLYAYVIEITP
jgi:hypothetical protein